MTSTLFRSRPVVGLTVLALAALVAGCGGEEPATSPQAGTPDAHGHTHDEGPHGGAVATVGDHAAHLEAVHDHDAGRVTIWLQDGEHQPVQPDAPPVLNLLTDAGSAQVRGIAADDGWRFEHEALKGHPEQARFRLQLGGKTYSPSMPVAHAHEGDHEHAPGAEHGPHDGMVAAFEDAGGAVAGMLELKLHDDKGDLELWICTDEAITTPFDLPLDATIGVTFHDEGDRKVTLRVRNTEQNEDEDGTPTVRGGMTNYFIFPGDTGADASWLQGASFQSHVTVTFEKDGTTYTASRFLLVPHTHGAGGHDHD